MITLTIAKLSKMFGETLSQSDRRELLRKKQGLNQKAVTKFATLVYKL